MRISKSNYINAMYEFVFFIFVCIFIYFIVSIFQRNKYTVLIFFDKLYISRDAENKQYLRMQRKFNLTLTCTIFLTIYYQLPIISCSVLLR